MTDPSDDEVAFRAQVEPILAVIDTTCQRLVGKLVDCACREIREVSGVTARCQKKLRRRAMKELADIGAYLDVRYALLRQRSSAELQALDRVICELAAKGNVAPVGTPLEQIQLILSSPLRPEGVTYAGELVLSVREAVPHVRELIAVLREIRDAIRCVCGTPPGPSAVPSAGEVSMPELPKITEDESWPDRDLFVADVWDADETP